MRARALCAALSALVVTAGCTSFADSGSEPEAEAEPAAQVGTAAPDERLTLVPEPDPVGAAVGASRALFETAEVVVLVPEGDEDSMLLGASAAVGLGVPLLVAPRGAESGGGPLADELERLGTGTVLSVGTDGESRDGDEGPEVIDVPADLEAVEAATGLEFASAEPVVAGEEAAAVAVLDPESPAALHLGDAPETAEDVDVDSLPEVTRGDALSDTVVLATGSEETVAGIATARAAGARVLLTGEVTDPRASADVIEALSEAPPESVVTLGAELAAEEGLDWKLETAATGAQLPGGGQLLFPGRLLIALYGHPGTAALGLLGEQDAQGAIQRARDLAAEYEPLVDVEVLPAFEIIATVASSSAGSDGNYSNEAELEVLRPWVEAAGEAGLYVVLDLQPGRTDFVTQAEQYRSLLELPHVGLALDPEWRLGPGEVHLRQIGSVEVEEVNRVVTWLADLTRSKALPQKLLVLHQFKLAMLPGRERVDTSREELSVMVHADGQGGQGDKQATWRVLRQNAPPALTWGWKNFIDEDLPMLTPEQTIAQVDPTPQLISYQ